METNERAAVQSAEKAPPCRRVGTLTFGIVLVVAGAAMLASMFFPRLDLTWTLKLSPLLLISLGVETLFSARHGGRVKYDWVGMILCCFIVTAAVGLFLLAWWLVHAPNQFCW